MKHCTVLFQPEGRRVSVPEGTTLLEAAGLAGLEVDAACGGKGICQRCTVLVGPSSNPVLACRCPVRDDVEVRVTQAAAHSILTSGLGRSVDVCPAIPFDDPAGPLYGVACDIGTTTVVARLLDLRTGKEVACAATMNPQAQHGHDVISRISYAESEQGLKELQRLILGGINLLLDDLCTQAHIDTRQIVQLCAVGNTTMGHLLLGLPVWQLGQAPYAAPSLDAHDVPARSLGIGIHPEGIVHTVENIAGFLGSDTTAVALAADVGNLGVPALILDIGTNGELLLEAAGRVYGASCAAGPAFEGARILHGSRAVQGAIESVRCSSGDIEVGVIGSKEPRSICGSGLVDAVAAMLDTGVLDVTGRLSPPDRAPAGLAKAIQARLVEVSGGPAFALAFDHRTGDPTVVLTQADIRQVQLAKAAIRAGIEILLHKTGLQGPDISRVLMAGAFGNSIRPQGAIRIGLLPEIGLERVTSIGNAACAGAEMILINKHCLAQAGRLARSIEHVEIALDRDFEQVFAEAMAFPAARDHGRTG